MTDWTKEFPGAVTVCDRHGVGACQGLVELSLEIPEAMPHVVREGQGLPRPRCLVTRHQAMARRP